MAGVRCGVWRWLRVFCMRATQRERGVTAGARACALSLASLGENLRPEESGLGRRVGRAATRGAPPADA